MSAKHRGMVILDADGTALDTIALHDEIGRRCAEEFGIPDFDIHGPDIRALFVKAGLSVEAYQMYGEIFSAYEKEKGVHVFPFVNDVLYELRDCGYMTGIFSNRKMRAHNHEMFFNSGLDYKLIDFFMMPLPLVPESDVRPELLHPIYIPTNFSKPCGFAALPLIEMIQEIPGAPRSVTYFGDHPHDFIFANRCDFSFRGVLSGVVKSSHEWIKLGVPNTSIMADIGNIPQSLNLSGRS